MDEFGSGIAEYQGARILQHPRAKEVAADGESAGQGYGDILENGPPAFVADTTGALVYANSAYRALAASAGTAGDEDKDELTLTPFALLQHTIETGEPRNFTHHIVIDGAVQHVGGYCWSPTSMSGPARLVVGIYHDLRTTTLESALSLAKARFDDIARLTSDWVWEVDARFHFTFASSRFTELSGLPARFLNGLSMFECATFEGFPEANRKLHPSPESRVPFREVYCQIAATDGRMRLFTLSGVPIFDEESGSFLGYRGTARDVTEVTEADARLTEAQVRLIHAIETMPQGFALFDAADKLILCNSRYEDFLAPGLDMIAPGVTFTDIINGARARGLFRGEEAELDQFVEDQIARHRMAAKDIEIQLSDDRWVLVTSEMTEGGGTIEVWNEITKMKQRETALRTAEEESRRAREVSEVASQTKSVFLANMSHELRTPLNAIIGFSEILKNEMFGPLGNNRYAEYVGDIYASGTHLLGVINDILEFSKAEAGKMELTERSVVFRDLLEGCLRLLRTRAADAGVNFRYDIDASLPNILVDETKFRQILLNLLSNGLKFTRPGGHIRIEATCDHEAGCTIIVADTGIGIRAEDIPKALSAFGQVDSTLSRKYEGTGLGLPLSVSMVERHNGTLTLQSEVGGGTTVTIKLPPERVVPPEA